MNKSVTPSKKPFYGFLPMIIITGFIQLLIPSTINMIMKNYGINTVQAGVLPLTYFMGMMIATIYTSYLITRFSVKQIIAMGAIMASVSLLISSQVHNYYLFVFLYLLVGLGNGLLMILPGIYATHVYGKSGAELQSVIFSFIAIGFILGPVFPGIIEYFKLSWQWGFIVPGVLIIPTLIPILTSNHVPIEHTSKLSIKVIKEIFEFDKPFFIGIMIVCAIGAGSSSAIFTWVITFLEQTRQIEPGLAHIILSILGGASVFGRRIWGRVAIKLTTFKTLIIITIAAIVFIFTAPFPDNITINIILFIISVIFIAGISPLSLSASSLYPKSHSSVVYTLLFTMAAVGGLAIPFLVGVLFHSFGPVSGMSSISIFVIGILISLLIIKKEMPISDHIKRHLLP